MIKTTCSIPLETTSYPLFARALDDGLIVLFTDKQTGTVIDVGTNKLNKIGQFAINWIPYTDSTWKILPPGTRITLEVC